ncbi:hypothetical protein NDU88_002479 [Pleurodeles waltl]|uniref:Uncharacterized protein n=1 Tax=Pleurodeles waltl TaxID=8319 RepID=A0AAV7KS90_PLEWA|nr:hypothetical protein NDU88_002479 [Pleurodeles waltl]
MSEGGCTRPSHGTLHFLVRRQSPTSEHSFSFQGRVTEEHDGKEESCGWVEPGELRAALIPWREEQAEPRAAGWSSSTGGQAKRTLAADAPERRCGGMGFAPAGAASSGEQRPGPSGMRGGPAARLADVELRGEWQQKRDQAEGVQRGDLWCEEECVLDFEERSFE